MKRESRALISAIQDQSVPSLPPTPGPIDTARQTCIRIGKDISATCDRIISALSRSGITATPETSDGPRQFHFAALQIAPAHLGAAIPIMEAEGFHPPCPMSPARLKVILNTQTALRFVSYDNVTTRISLTFAERPRTLLPQVLRPQIQDIADIDLPAPLYTPWRALRLIGARMAGRQSSLGENDFLGTPESLILPLMKAVGVTQDDTLLDLGCGDGRILISAVKGLGCRGIGVELNDQHASRGRDLVAKAGLSDRISIITGAAKDASLTDATIIFVFLPHSLSATLLPQILAERQSGARVLIHEQNALAPSLTPDRSLPVVAEDALTVAHIWD